MTTNGVQYAMIDGEMRLPVLSVVNLDSRADLVPAARNLGVDRPQFQEFPRAESEVRSGWTMLRAMEMRKALILVCPEVGESITVGTEKMQGLAAI